ncbi:MAG: nuclear transport factor 2 family protein [Spirochaetaceae bacterium]|nr:nuclear transport factor 2 family protein [Myxococcales bacterium]MCB9724013.1 nuclear transport factor 2 family protein [Spirochaetaceae bacterium]HPG24622.1 nuclear transport factor 2 family protein [Myxococcota bacterium]
MLTLQEISDRLEIQDLVWRYSEIIDTKDFDKLRDEVFTPDAFIDYSAFGGSKGDLETTIAFLHKAMKVFPHHQHMNGNIQIKLDGDRATGKVMCINPQECEPKSGEKWGHIFFCGLWYLDEYVRTPAGWRIRKRVEDASYVYNAPAFMQQS